MNRTEFSQRLSDFVLGKKVEGTVAAILPSQIGFSDRYAVRTESDEIVDTHISEIQTLFPFPVYFPRPTFRIGEKINERAVQVKPWIDGQII